MKLNKIIGILIISMSFLTTAILVMLVRISQFADQSDGSYYMDISHYTPNSLYFLVTIPFISGFILLFWDKILDSINEEKGQ